MKTIHKNAYISLAALIFTLSIGNCFAMDKPSNVLQFKNANRGPFISLFSAVEGAILDNGKPVVGVKVERSYHFTWIDKDFSDSTITDDHGRYTFSEATTWMLLGSIFPHEPVIPQEIKIYPKANKEGLSIWQNAKRNYDTMGELYGLQPYLEQTLAKNLTPVMQGFINGKLRLDCDLATISSLSDDDTEFQSVNSFNTIISACDLQLPYQVALNQSKRLVTKNKEHVQAALHSYLAANVSAFKALQEERLSAYSDLSYVNIESTDLYDRIELVNSDANIHQSQKTVELGGEIIMQMKNSKDEIIRIRVWLSDAHFQIDQQNVIFLANYNALIFNEFNIDAEGEA